MNEQKKAPLYQVESSTYFVFVCLLKQNYDYETIKKPVHGITFRSLFAFTLKYESGFALVGWLVRWLGGGGG